MNSGGDEETTERDARLCPECGEPAAGGGPARDCPLGGNFECVLVDDEGSSTEADVDPLGKTVVFRTSGSAPLVPDGFPEVEDLAESEFGQYRLGQIIGRGSMGRVYRAEHLGLHRYCAVKVMNPSMVAREAQTLNQFWAEARAVAALVHPHIVTVHNLGTQRGYHFIEMELVEYQPPQWREYCAEGGSYVREYIPGGVSLSGKLVRDGRFDAYEATRMVRQVAMGLSAAHGAGLVHRDVKPANVLLSSDGSAKLADFGLVRRLGDRRDGGMLAGTPTYMAPELFRGLPASPRSDLYALGVMYFYLLTGRLPFSYGSVTDYLRRSQRAELPEIRLIAPELPDDVVEVVHRLLDHDPAGRYESAEALAYELRLILGGLRDTASLVQEALCDVPGTIHQTDRDRFRVMVHLPGDRIQEVHVESHQGSEQELLLTVYSLCGNADAGHYEYALRLNAKMSHGSVSIRDLGDRAMFVICRSFVRNQATPEVIRAAVMEIAAHGDRVEQQLSETDLY